MATPVEEGKGIKLKPGPGRVEFKEVHFSYVPQREVLRGISFVIEPGKTTGIVGPSGAGKTTMMDLLLRLYEPTSGTIAIDSQSITELDPSSVRSEVGVVAADGAIFRGTLAENICYKRSDAAEDDVRSAAIAAGLRNTLERLPDGLDTEVGEGGIGLSVGERQRVQLARVLLANPRVLILDEATANLDYATELDVKRTLAELRRGRTTIVIAHRYSMVKDADWILVLEEGQLVESGTPAQLISSAGWFATLAEGAGREAEEVET
jgi:ABC-type multidrug transport system fused ATPase/permease subunit